MKRWNVLTAMGEWIVVEAHYFRVQDGVLAFRIHVRDNYPEPVRVFAPGYWLEVTQ